MHEFKRNEIMEIELDKVEKTFSRIICRAIREKFN